MNEYLFCENYDLFQVIETQLKIDNSIEDAITESEMMISIYDTQRFLVEQDTQIFMGLKYDIVNEGVLDKIGTVIKTIFGKIIQLISNFINFITGKRKKDKEKETITKKVEENEEKIAEEVKKETKETYTFVYDTDKMFNDINNMSKEIDKEMIKSKQEKLDNLKDQLKDLDNTSDSYIPIYINQNVMRNINISDKWEELENMIDTAYNILSLVKQKKDIDEEFSKIKNFTPLSGNVRINSDKNDEKAIYADYNNLCDRETYYNKYYKNAKAFFRNYTDDSSKNITYLQNLLDKRIKPLEKETSKIISSIDKNDNYKKTANKFSLLVQALSRSCSERIQSLFNVEKVYQAYKKNMMTTANYYIEIKKLKKDTEKLQSDIEYLNKTPEERNEDLRKTVNSIKDKNPDLYDDLMSYFS